ncbi:MAG: hypothetical protein KF901_10835 [Myxococcales bacterium]|nr:hypothetical protein [Myxococcales bacterium]
MRGTWLGWCGWVAVALGGCGLTLDLSPPDLQVVDGGGRDASVDGGRCRTDLECDDGDRCNGLERCDEGRCVSGESVVCPVEDRCETSFECEPATGECTREVSAPRCPEGDPCTGLGYCDPSVGCTFGPPLRCDDGVACTRDFCDEGECKHEENDELCDAAPGGECDDEDDCQYPTCSDETCRPLNPCQVARCEGDRCVRSRMECPAGRACCAGECAPLGCDDGNVCTDDFCDDARGCQHVAHARGCDDGDRCTTADRCIEGVCRGGPACPVGANVCVRPTCDPATGTCGTVNNDGASCSDADPCTTGDMCSGGVCRGGVAVDCSVSRPCQVGICGPAGCTTTNASNGTACTITIGMGVQTGMCADGACVVGSLCEAGLQDCNGNGICDCAGTCDAGRCVSGCERDEQCSRGYCCLNAGSLEFQTCIAFDDACLGGPCCSTTAD